MRACRLLFMSLESFFTFESMWSRSLRPFRLVFVVHLLNINNCVHYADTVSLTIWWYRLRHRDHVTRWANALIRSPSSNLPGVLLQIKMVDCGTFGVDFRSIFKTYLKNR